MERSFVRAVTLGAFLLLAAPLEAQATIRRVPTDYPTIQQAINASVNGDTVMVAPGTYYENINFLGKAITVTSEEGPEITTIDGNYLAPVVRFNSGEGPTSVLNGLTLQHGNRGEGGMDAKGVGGGISIEQSSPTISDNIIISNTASSGGAGIGVFFGSPLIQRNEITGNAEAGSAGVGAGGIDIAGTSSAQILNNTISNNAYQNGGGVHLTFTGNQRLIVKDNVIQGNNGGPTGGGIEVEGDLINVAIIQNLITRNVASFGGGIYIAGTVGEIVSNTIADNFGFRGTGVFLQIFTYLTKYHNNILTSGNRSASVFNCEVGVVPFLEPPVFMNNNFFGSLADLCPMPVGSNGNISADPLFVNPSAGDYHLRPGSPSIDTGDNGAPNLPATDLDGNLRIQDGNGDGTALVDMGVYETLSPAPPFDICIQDDSSGSIFKFNSTTGDYQFTNCAGFTLNGVGSLIQRGSTITLQHYASDRRVLARIDTSVNKATASIQLLSPSTTFTITDRNTANNTCVCTAQ